MTRTAFRTAVLARCDYGWDCLEFTSPSSVDVRLDSGSDVVSIDDYVPHCGNAHFPPNGEAHYDIDNLTTVMSTCTNWWSTPGGVSDPATSFDAADIPTSYQTWSDCTGPWQIWWWQNWPGLDNDKRDADDLPVRSWWPYLFY